MQTFLERLLQLKGNLKDSEFARHCDVKYTSMKGYLDGRMPGFDIAAKIAEANGVSLDWLYGRSTIEAGSLIAASETQVALPRYEAEASAGTGSLVISEDVADYFVVQRDWLETIAPKGARTGVVMARGDSMLPTIADGDALIVNFDIDLSNVEHGGVFLISFDGTLICKRLIVQLGGNIQIISDNTNYPVQEVTREMANEYMTVHGEVVWAGGPLKYRG